MKYSAKVVGPRVTARQQHSTQQASKFHLANYCGAPDQLLDYQTTRWVKFSIPAVWQKLDWRNERTFGVQVQVAVQLCNMLNQDKTIFATFTVCFCMLCVGRLRAHALVCLLTARVLEAGAPQSEAPVGAAVPLQGNIRPY